MFGKNKIVVPKDFKQVAHDVLQVTTMFPTLQGEGPFAGEPAVFLRLTGCNLKCSFCDTYFDSGEFLTFDEIFMSIEGMAPPSLGRKLLLVITGGEPMMQRNLTNFLLRTGHYRTQIESNGNFFMPLHWNTTLVISPKINEKTNQYIKVHPQALQRADALKFVVSKTMPGYTDIPDWALKWAEDDEHLLYLSPMNMYARQPIKLGPDGTLEQRSEVDERISFWTPGLLDLERNQENHEHAAYLAMKYGVKLSLQMHLYANLP